MQSLGGGGSEAAVWSTVNPDRKENEIESSAMGAVWTHILLAFLFTVVLRHRNVFCVFACCGTP